MLNRKHNLAGHYLDDPCGLETAQAVAESFRTGDLAAGVTSGGPGDCVQAPDSESGCALVESFILLHEATGENKWLEAAC